MADSFYTLPEEPVYNTEIRKLQNSDPANAETVFNPLVQAILENIQYVRLRLDILADGSRRYIAATRPRDPTKPLYGLDGTRSVSLETEPYTGDAELGVVVSGVLLDAKNMSFDGEVGPDGTIILKTEVSQNG